MFWIAQQLFAASGFGPHQNNTAYEDWRLVEARERLWRSAEGALPPSPAATPPGVFVPRKWSKLEGEFATLVEGASGRARGGAVADTVGVLAG